MVKRPAIAVPKEYDRYSSVVEFSDGRGLPNTVLAYLLSGFHFKNNEGFNYIQIVPHYSLNGSNTTAMKDHTRKKMANHNL